MRKDSPHLNTVLGEISRFLSFISVSFNGIYFTPSLLMDVLFFLSLFARIQIFHLTPLPLFRKHIPPPAAFPSPTFSHTSHSLNRLRWMKITNFIASVALALTLSLPAITRAERVVGYYGQVLFTLLNNPHHWSKIISTHMKHAHATSQFILLNLLSILWPLKLPCKNKKTAGGVSCSDYPPFDPKDLPIDLYTHLNFAFALIEDSGLIASQEAKEIPKYQLVNDLKKKKPSLRTAVTVGGWDMNMAHYSTMVSTRENRQKFIRSAIAFVRRYGFDGLDFDWE